MNRVVRSVSMLAVGLTLGLLLSLTWRPQASSPVGETRLDTTDFSGVWPSIDRLEGEQRELRTTLADLRKELAERQQDAVASTDRLQALQAELERQQSLAGLTAVRGPGVLAVLDDSAAPIPTGADPNDYLVHEYDIRDVVNLLWMAGSEAIAVNDERLVSSSSIYCLGSTVMVNDTRLSPPYSIRAIGNPRVQLDYLHNPSYLGSLKERQRLVGLRFDAESIGTMTLPAYSGALSVQYARPGD